MQYTISYILRQLFLGFCCHFLSINKIYNILKALNEDITMYENYFIERLTSLRQQKNVSAREMILALGQNDSYINRIENGKAFPSMQVFFYICEYLEVTPQEFWDYENNSPKKIDEISTLLRKYSPEQLDAFLNLLQKIK